MSLERREHCGKICSDCPKSALKKMLAEAALSDDPLMRQSAALAKGILRLQGCLAGEPTHTNDFSRDEDDYGPTVGRVIDVCGNPNAEIAETILTRGYDQKLQGAKSRPGSFYSKGSAGRRICIRDN
jgi:hypothetical protein